MVNYYYYDGNEALKLAFVVILLLVITQRMVELIIAKRNEKWMIQQGGYEVGRAHYPMMIMLHSSFFIFLLLEVLLFNRALSNFFILLLVLFLLTQAGRLWCLSSLGKLWNTRIIINPNLNVIKKGPYRFLKHPNYVIVSLEFIILPLLFNAYFTAIIFTLLNVWMLSVRIPIEEKALRDATNYSTLFPENKASN